ncbi:hypothetical protein [Flavobacterium rhizosphaerae]|uniref:Uncharacterized protein n=1 Tax=Flavobacterium rhizosphaerae TaxID=3163298 RepID=A0ABW8YZZ5_9FLAO
MTNDSIVMNKYLDFNSFKFYITDNTFQKEYTFNDKKLNHGTVILGNYNNIHSDDICVKKNEFYIDNAPRIFDLDFIDKFGMGLFFTYFKSMEGFYVVESNKKKHRKLTLIKVQVVRIGYSTF